MERCRRGYISDSEWQKHGQQKAITLSLLLDDVVILEERIKELVATVDARRNLGIDLIRYIYEPQHELATSIKI